MPSKTKEEILTFIDSLIQEGEQLSKTRSESHRSDNVVAEPPKQNWIPRIRTLGNLLGNRLDPWRYKLDHVPTDSTVETVLEFLGVLRAIRESVESGLMIQVERLVLAETIGDLLEQADHLAESGYLLAAGVLGRAVLEEHLRKWCESHECLPSGRPTINDLNRALYKERHLDKLGMQQVTALAATGNHCAHNVEPPLGEDDVKRFLRDVREFAVRHPIG